MSTTPDPPAFDLTILYDDPEDPSEVTLVPGDSDSDSDPARFLTEWITADTETAVPLSETR